MIVCSKHDYVVVFSESLCPACSLLTELEGAKIAKARLNVKLETLNEEYTTLKAQRDEKLTELEADIALMKTAVGRYHPVGRPLNRAN